MGVGAPAPPRLLARAARTAAALLALSVSCTQPPAERDAAPDEGIAFPARTSLRIATGPVESLDPIEIRSADELVIADQVFEGLSAYEAATSRISAAAAETWDITEGGRRFIFHLREGARFHDGSAIEAADFVFSWNRLADPVARAPYSFLLESVAGYDAYQSDVRARGLDGVRAIDETTFEVRLVRPWPDFVSILGHPALAPLPSDATGLGVGVQPIGNGAYRLTEPIGTGEDIRLERFEGYVGSPPPQIERLVFRPFDEEKDAWPEFLAGELEIAPIPPSLLVDAQGRYGTDGIRPLSRLLYCGFRQDDPRFRDRALRRAVSLAIDRAEIAAGVYAGLAVPATGLVPPGVPGYQRGACGAFCDGQTERARTLVRSVPTRDRAFALDVTDSDVGVRLGRLLVEQLEAAGLDVTVRRHEPPEYAQLLDRGRQELFCLVWVGDFPRQQALLEPLLLSSSPANHTGIAMRALDRLLTEARASRSREERQELYRRAESFALSAMPLVPIVWFRSNLAAKPYVEGFRVSPLGTFDAADLRIAPEG